MGLPIGLATGSIAGCTHREIPYGTEAQSALVLGLAVGVIQAPFTVIAATMLARIYVQLAGRGDAQVSVPSSGI